jgi:hypothetical protein
VLIAGFGIIFWQFKPQGDTPVPYNPWFLDQVEKDNIKSLVSQGQEVHGELRKEVEYTPPGEKPKKVLRIARSRRSRTSSAT